MGKSESGLASPEGGRRPLERFIPRERDENGKKCFYIDGPFGLKLKGELEESGASYMLRLARFESNERPSKAGGAPDGLIALKDLIEHVKDTCDERGFDLARVDIPLADPELQKLLFVEGMDELLGEEEVGAAKTFHNPTREQQEARRSSDPKPKTLSLTLEEITARLKEYEHRHGTI
jgi:hypothetical protein